MAIVGDAYVVVHAVTKGFEDDIKKAMNGLQPFLQNSGNQVGNAFANAFGGRTKKTMSQFRAELDGARLAFNKLIKVGYFAGPAISGLVGAVSSLVSGLFALGSALGAATPALASFGGLITSLAQGMIVAKVAMGGVGNAVKALLNQADSSGKGQQRKNNTAVNAAKRALRDARIRLAELYDTIESKVTKANDRIAKAQNALNQAYIKGAESIRKLKFEAEGAAYSQERAAIELERARETLMRVQDLPPDSRARREAELAFKEAELNYRMTTDKTNQLREAVAYANATGVDGTEEVLSAKEDLYEAESALGELQEENAKDLRRAQQDVADAMGRLREAKAAGDGAGQSLQAVNDAMKDLSPEARAFARYIAGLKDEMLLLRWAAGQDLFPLLTEAIENLVNKLLPRLIPIFKDTGRVVGEIAVRFSEMLTSTRNLDIFDRVFGESNLKILKNIGFAFVDIFEGLLNILDAARPLAETFARFIRNTSEVFKINMMVANSTGQLTEKFNTAGGIAGQFGSLIKELWLALKELGKSAVDSGLKIVQYFTEGSQRLREFAENGRKTGELKVVFDQIADNFIAISAVLGDIIASLFRLGANPGVKEFADGIRPAVKIFEDIGNTLMTDTGPGMAEFVVQLAELLKLFTETGGLQLFFKVLNMALSVAVALFSNEVVQKAFMFLAAIKGITLAFGVLNTVVSFFGKALLGNLLVAGKTMMLMLNPVGALKLGLMGLGNAAGQASLRMRMMAAANQNAVASKMTLGGAVKMATSGIVAFGGALKVLLVPMLPIIAKGLLIAAVIAALIYAFKQMWDNSEKLRNAFGKVADMLKNAFAQAWDRISKALGVVMPKFEDMGEFFGKIGDFIAPAVEWIGRYLVQAIDNTVDVIVFLIDMVQLLIEWFGLPFRAIGAAIEAIRTGNLDPLKQAFIDFANKAIDALNSLIDIINNIPFVEFEKIEKLEGPLDNVTTAQNKANREFDKARRIYEENTQRIEEMYEKYGDLEQIIDRINGALETEFERLTASARAKIDNIKNTKEFADAQKTLTEELKNNAKFTLESKDAMAEFAGTYLDAAENAIAAGENQEAVAKILEQGRKSFVDAAKDAGYTADEAKRMADNFALTPATIKKTFEAKGLGDLQEMANRLQQLKDLKDIPGFTSTFGVSYTDSEIRKLEEGIAKGMTKAFGRGQARDTPMFVEETVNPFKGMALGGPVYSGQSYMVGEKGPELFVPRSGGTIIPNNELSAAGVTGGPASAPVFNIYPSQGMNEGQIAAAVARKLEWTRMRGM